MKIIKSIPYDGYHFEEVHFSFIDKLFIKTKYRKIEFNRNMFDQDFSRIFNYSFNKKNKLFNIESNNEKIANTLIKKFRTSHNFHSTDEQIRSLIEDIAQSLIYLGAAYYFIYDNESEDDINISSFKGIGLFNFYNLFLQLVPKRLNQDSDNNKIYQRELRLLDKSKLIKFNIPKKMKKILFLQNRILASLDKHQYNTTKFHSMATYKNPNPSSSFDFLVWQATQEKILYHATRKTGWNCRKNDASKHSEFFIYHRLIKFRRNQLILRDHILKQLSAVLTNIGNKYTTNFYITITPTSHLSKIEELNELEARLAKEEVSFTDVLNFCYERE
ncbi:hypothetical protein M0K80_RS06990 [Providencia rettgeri]|nr:hypothetical protein [Providencia rettgeri]